MLAWRDGRSSAQVRLSMKQECECFSFRRYVKLTYLSNELRIAAIFLNSPYETLLDNSIRKIIARGWMKKVVESKRSG